MEHDWSGAQWQWAEDEESDDLIYYRCSSRPGLPCQDLLPSPPEFVPPPPAPPGLCSSGLISEDLQYCPSQLIGSDRGALSALLGPWALPLLTVFCAILITVTMVAAFLFCKHKKKVEHFLPCKSNQVPGSAGASSVPGSGINPLLLNHHNSSHHTSTLHPFLQSDAINPIELSDVKCGAYGSQQAAFTTLPSAFRGIVTPSVISLNDPQRSQRRKPPPGGGLNNKEQYNPIYEQVLDQDRPLEDDEDHSSSLRGSTGGDLDASGHRKQSCSSDSIELNSNMQYALEPKQSYYQSKTPLSFQNGGQRPVVQSNTLNRRTLLHPYQPVTENIYAVIDDEVHNSPRLPYTMDRLNGARRMPVVSVQQPQRPYATGGRHPTNGMARPPQMARQYPSVYSEQDMSPYSNT